ncbi:MAG: Tat pathway signal protein [Anaerotardibacter sp.]
MPQKRRPNSNAPKSQPTRRSVNPRPKVSSSYSSANKKNGFSTSLPGPLSSTESSRPSLDGSRSGIGKPVKRSDYGEGGFSSGGFSAGDGVPFSRRSLLIGAGALAGVALVGGVGSQAVSSNTKTTSELDILSVPEDKVTNLTDLSEVASADHVALIGNFKLPYGTLCWADNSTVAACLVPGETSSPLNTVRLLYLSTGSNPVVLTNAVNHDKGFEIIDVRCSDSGMIWVEANLFTNQWIVMTGLLSGGTVTGILQVDQGDGNWVSPSIAAVQNRAFWQVCPTTTGDNANDRSALKHAVFGSSEVGVAWTSKRAFATRVTPVIDGVVITPRADSTSVHYQLTKISAADATMVDQLTLPASMKPFEATYLGSGFSFSFDAIYNYGGGIANLGTYAPMQATNAYSYNDSEWFRFGRTPTAAPCWSDGWFIAKSTRTIVGIHFPDKVFFSIDIADNTDTYGEYLISSGTQNTFCGLSQIKSTKAGEESYAQVRVYSII